MAKRHPVALGTDALAAAEEVASPFAAWLAAESKRRNWRQRQLAQASGVSQQTASRWLAGRSTPAGIHLRSLAEAFGVTTDAILALCERSAGERRTGPRAPEDAEVLGRDVA